MRCYHLDETSLSELFCDAFYCLVFCTKEFESALEFSTLVMGGSEMVQLNLLSVLD